ncbi:A-kinase anchor protein 4-like isoform X1 [Apteryx rowi]|uniref:A-kinase anchor protein 4-like isoform X1 n=1 Tax=Apteryx rowi TaxID=308060 RepID=UPI000E1CCB00|nr:A-kinase anchor protein 4-like isoform X1 [Apteryx rowi]XP_025911661.1 A-kinase anchor protein 4-like isoform X1 [Apteryx rowi]XP_025911662.1 A-kinase anchor protein 4-like isoform X1 [Apteryx rowi]XP_025911664.1 A-kinase anchor protein 4-like isoform X1 [Apteryx rowi]XP_025911665.1 A-kinase anchor protein 4-like isoform X1 [Apteryx rowi]XP_025911666.1 A-kinase anchor protein 4-like isoform X1 [Apteryx rowi]XP_025911667.1 A-kinase anchor protein 4-like isoform X1 [Apteryx rowi]
MAHKEISEKSDSPDSRIHKTHFAVLGEPAHKSVGVGTNEDKNPSENVTHANMKETKCEENPPSKKAFFYKEVRQSSSRDEPVQENKKCNHRKRFGQDEFTNTLSKGILNYANNVVSDIMVSVMKTMKGQANDSNIACIVLKSVLLKHSKAVVSDFIDSCMKNLHDVTGKLLTNSDFASSVKQTLFTVESRKAAEIVQAMLNHLHSSLIVQKPGGDKSQSQSLSYASMKASSRTADAKAQNLRFAATKSETLPKEMTCAEVVGNHILKQGLTLWHENQNQCSQCSKSQPGREVRTRSPDNMPWGSEIQDVDNSSPGSWAERLIVTALLLLQYHLIQQENATKNETEGNNASKPGPTAFGLLLEESYGPTFQPASEKSQDSSKEAEESDSQSDTERQKSENGMSSAMLMLVRKLINETVCKIEGQPGNPVMNEMNQNSVKSTERHISLADVERFCEEAMSGLTKIFTDQLDLSGKDGCSTQFIDSLVDTVTKLSLMVAKYSNPESSPTETGSREDFTGSVGSKGTGTADSVAGSSEETVSGHRVVVINQNPSENIYNKQVRALLQWMVASQTDMPVLYFLDDDEEFLDKVSRTEIRMCLDSVVCSVPPIPNLPVFQGTKSFFSRKSFLDISFFKQVPGIAM